MTAPSAACSALDPLASTSRASPEEQVVYPIGSDVSDLLLVPCWQGQQQQLDCYDKPAEGRAADVFPNGLEELLVQTNGQAEADDVVQHAGHGLQPGQPDSRFPDYSNLQQNEQTDEPRSGMTFASVHAMLSSIRSPSVRDGLRQKSLLAAAGPLQTSSDEASQEPADGVLAMHDTADHKEPAPSLMPYAQALQVLGEGWHGQFRSQQIQVSMPLQGSAPQQKTRSPASTAEEQHWAQTDSQPQLHDSSQHDLAVNVFASGQVCPSLDMATPQGAKQASWPHEQYDNLNAWAVCPVGYSGLKPEGTSYQPGRAGTESEAAADDPGEPALSMGLSWLKAASEVTARQQVAMEVIERRSNSSRCQAQRQLAFQQVCILWAYSR